MDYINNYGVRIILSLKLFYFMSMVMFKQIKSDQSCYQREQ